VLGVGSKTKNWVDCNIWAGSVTIMASTKQKNSKLNFDWGLGGVGVIVENVVGVDLVGDTIC